MNLVTVVARNSSTEVKYQCKQYWHQGSFFVMKEVSLVNGSGQVVQHMSIPSDLLLAVTAESIEE